VAKNSFCTGGQATAICTWRYTPALAVLTITPAPTSGGLTNGKVPKTFHVEDTKRWAPGTHPDRAACPTLGNVRDRDCHFMRHVANFGQRMNSDPKPKRERFEQLTQNPKVKTGKAFATELRKNKVHPTVKKLTTWRKLNRLSQRKAVVVLAQYYFHATFASLRSWEEGRRSPNSHTAAILEKFLLDHPTVEPPKK
jgi:DNA-binding transcriptional regulator YiaG